MFSFLQSANPFGNHFDHLSLHISLSNASAIPVGGTTKPKHFELYWIKEDECLEFFDKLWIPNPTPSAESVRDNLHSILDHLLEWSKKKYINFPLRIKQLKQKLNNIRSQPSWLATEEATLELELDNCLRKKKITGRQDPE